MAWLNPTSAGQSECVVGTPWESDSIISNNDGVRKVCRDKSEVSGARGPPPNDNAQRTRPRSEHETGASEARGRGPLQSEVRRVCRDEACLAGIAICTSNTARHSWNGSFCIEGIAFP